MGQQATNVVDFADSKSRLAIFIDSDVEQFQKRIVPLALPKF